MSTKEERDRRRQERLAAEKQEAAAERRRLLIGYVVAGLLGAAVVIGLVVVIGASGGGEDQIDGEDLPAAANIQVQSGFLNDATPDGREGTQTPPIEQGDLAEAAKAAKCDLQTDLPEEGNAHLRPNDDPPGYDTNPPTSGDHDPQQQADGAYTDADEVHTVHSMEHGRVSLPYSPDLPKKEQLALKGVFDEDPDGVLFYPDPDMPYAVAATAWTQLLACKTFEGQATLDAIRDFFATYRGFGPEPLPIHISE